MLGAGVTCAIQMAFANGLFAGAWGGYEWLQDNITVDVEPTTVDVDASG